MQALFRDVVGKRLPSFFQQSCPDTLVAGTDSLPIDSLPLPLSTAFTRPKIPLTRPHKTSSPLSSSAPH